MRQDRGEGVSDVEHDVIYFRVDEGPKVVFVAKILCCRGGHVIAPSVVLVVVCVALIPTLVISAFRFYDGARRDARVTLHEHEDVLMPLT